MDKSLVTVAADCHNAGRESVPLKDDCMDLPDLQYIWLLLLSVVETHGRLVHIQIVCFYLYIINTLLLLGACSQHDLLALWLRVS